MQLALQTLIYRTTELNTVQASDNTAAMSAELSGFRFSDLMHVMHAPAPELSPESTGERKLPLVGMRLPSAGNTLPATGDLLAAANPKGVLSAKINEILNESDRSLLSARPAGEALNETGRSLPLARPDSEADGPYARSLVAEVVRNMNTFGDPEPVPQGPGKVAGTASMFTGQPEPAVSPAESKLFDQIRNPAEVSERPQTLSHNSVYPSPALPRAVRDGAPGHRGNPRVVLPPAGLRESALSGPRPASAPESHVPAGAIIDQLSQPQSPRKGTPAPFIQEAEFGRLTDNQPGNRDDAARSAIAKMHDYRADAANRVPQELETLKMLAETHGAKPPLSIAPPTVQPAIAIVPFSGASPAPSTSATAPAVTVVTVDTPVFDPAWADALQNRVLWLAGRNIQTAEIRLNPAELGSLQVQISVDDNSVDIAFRATQAATREALEIALPRLKDMLAENGMSLADASVSDQGIADQRDDSNRNMAADTDPSDENSTQAVSDLLPGRRTTKEPTGLVDTYV